MKNEVLNFFNKPNLTIDVLDSILSEGWLKNLEKSPHVQCFFNLSQVRFAQLQAITKLTLIIAKCLEKTKHPVLVALPTVKFTIKEQEALKHMSSKERYIMYENLRKRKEANAFLKNFRFDKVLNEIPQILDGQLVLLTESFEFASAQKREELEKAIYESFTLQPLINQSYKNNSNYKCICPLTWIACKSNETPALHLDQYIFNDVERILGHSEKGLDPLDAEAIKNVVLPELIKNVREHSRKNHALLAIGLISTKSILPSEKLVSPDNATSEIFAEGNIEKPYLDWLFENQKNTIQKESQVEIYFGDVGTGILTNSFEKKYLNDQKHFSQNEKICSSPEEKMQWVYSRWAAEKTKLDEDGNQLSEARSGTKGLYRIRRIIRRYEGVFHITTSSETGYVYDSIYRDYESLKQKNDWGFRQQNQYGFEGTFIQIKMCPFSKATKFRFILDNETSNTKWEFWNYSIELDETGEPVLHETEFSNKIHELHYKLYGASGKQSIDDACIVIFIDLTKLKGNATSDSCGKIKKFIQQKFPYFSLYGHPASIILVLSKHIVSNSVLESELSSLTDGLSQRITNVETNPDKSMHNEHYYAPVMVIGENRKVFWFGGHKESIEFLNSKTNEFDEIDKKTGKDKEVFFSSEIICNETDRKRIMKVLHADGATDLFYYFHNVTKIFQDELRGHYIRNEDKLFCSPSLEITKNWFEIGDFFNNIKNTNSLKYAWLFLLKIEQFFKDFPTNKNKKIDYHKTYLLIDHSQQQLLAEEFARLTGIPQENIRNLQRDIDSNIPHRVKLFPKYSKVILLTTIISSSETARRLVKFVRRDSATPVCLLCLYNRRKKQEPNILMTWGDKTIILSILEEEQSTQMKNSSDDILLKIKEEKQELGNYFNDNGAVKKNKSLIVKSPQYENELDLPEQLEDRDLLRNWINNSSALHYNHIGIFNSRHFTFYLDKQKLLKFFLENPGWKRLDKNVKSWRNSHNIGEGDFSICVPANLFSNNSKENSFYRHLCSLCDESQIYILDKNEGILTKDWNKKNIVFIDFGIINGNTITSFINEAQRRGVINILACIFFEQSRSSLTCFFKHVYSLTNDVDRFFIPNSILENKSGTDNYTDYLPLPEFENLPQSLPSVPIINIAVRYLFSFPLSYFTSELCPLCEHQKALEKYMRDIPYFMQFSEERQQRLRLLSVEEIMQREPADFYYTKDKKGFEMPPEFVWKMFEVKCMLEDAIKNTHARIRLFNYVYQIYQEINTQLKNPNSDLYALLFFLAHEVYWFQRDPLTYRKFRILLGEISKTIAIYSIEKLQKHFCKKIEGEIDTPEIYLNQATRYKYSAVSVLRSSNKNLFCNNVREMLTSAARFNIMEGNKKSIKSKVFSNNIIQNIFYHIISLCRNEYNTSLTYFKILREQLLYNEIEQINSCYFSPEQQTAIRMTRLQIEEAYWRIYYPSKSMFDDIRHLKTFFDEYKGKSHPHPCDCSRNFMAKPSLTTWYPLSKILQQIRSLVKRNELIYLPADLTLLNLAEWNEAETAIQKIEEMVYEAEKNNCIDLTNDKSFENYGELINKFFINFAGQYGENKDSIVKRWVDDMITDFNSALIVVFPQEKFINRRDPIGDSIGKKFIFPLSCLINCLYHIKDNMKKRVIKNKFLENINITTSITKERTGNIKIILEYDSTTREKQNNHIGGLTQFKQLFDSFNASLEWEQLVNNSSDFRITMKFKIYE